MKKILLLIFSLTIIYQTKALKLSSRLSKQFKDGDNEAMSLVDALQQWADALEAQISMMRAEVIEVKISGPGFLTYGISCIFSTISPS